ncbi:MAG TPA: YceI family protein [Bryobacteraceae bacterium]|nr:YceI family protein [Bryobacteraceae bacterium]
MSEAQSAAASATTYTIDPAHSNAHFKVRHMMIANVRGEFGKVAGTVRFDSAHPEASEIVAEIDVNSINTREPQRDAHLKSADFLDAANHPTIRFQSKKAQAAGPGAYKVTGDLTIRGVTREVVLTVDGPTPENKDPWGVARSGAEATAKISRKDFGLNWNQALEAGGVLVGDHVDITIDVELMKA